MKIRSNRHFGFHSNGKLLFLHKFFRMSWKFVFRNIVIVLLLLPAGNLLGQTVNIDSTKTKLIENDTTEVHSPKKATLYSTFLPGLGQVYNKKYWKVPIIYGGFGVIGYFIGWNNRNYGVYKQAYKDLTDDDPATDSYNNLEATQYYDLNDPNDLNNFKDGLSKQTNYYRRNRDLLVICMAGFYGLQIIDASVDAHLFNFEISEDLSMNWQPALRSNEKMLTYGVNLTFNF